MATHDVQLRSFGSLVAIAIPLLSWGLGACGGQVSIGDDVTVCAATDCGGMPAIACADGSSPFTGRCIKSAGGKCGWEPRACPPTPPPSGECDVSACGPAPKGPSTTCSDGSIGGFTGRCLRSPAGTCGWEYRDCPPPPPPPPTPVSCDISTWSGIEKSCSGDTDCAFGFHQLNCCGSQIATGFNAKSAATFAADESACDKTYPACGCAGMPPTAEDGLTASSPGAIGVGCSAGKCNTYVRMTK